MAIRFGSARRAPLARFVVAAGVALLVACGDGAVTPGLDASFDGATIDLGDVDARVTCTGDVDCNDGLFCNGREMCAPASAMADVRGCVPGDAPCAATETCDESANDCRTICEDLDGDGVDSVACGGDDCDDTDATRYPGATEVCDGNDEDCNDATFGFVDADMDGAGSAACCNGTTCGTDCDDANALVRPGVADGPAMNCNGADDDCDGIPDVGCPCSDGERRPCYGGPAGTRGIGICADGISICAGGVLGAECLEDVLPADEFCNVRDDDCDGIVDDGVLPRFYRDDDGDSFGQTAVFVDDQCSPPPGFAAGANDCDDTNPARFPGAADICNLIDDDCDGTDDEGAPPVTYYRDADGDGFGVMTMQLSVCGAPAGYVAAAGDCDDTRPFVSPVGTEACDAAAMPLDEDCDGAANEGCACTDGATRACGGGAPVRGACRAGVQRCIAGAWAGCSGNIDPGTLTETCNGLDDDCDGMTDETLLAASCYLDADSDGFGSGAVITTLCADPSRSAVGSCPSGYTNAGGTAANTDCNDANGVVRPGGTETCNGVDDDCDGTIDEGVTRTYYRDADGDGFGALATTATGCTAPTGFVAASGDCDDARASSSPVGVEVCDATMRDEDCDSTANEGCACIDGSSRACGGGSPIRGVCRAGTQLCIAGAWASCSGNIDPGTLTETCNGLDDDCDGMTDETLLAASCYLDADSDGFGSGTAITTICRDASRMAAGFCPSGYANVAGDCNDSDSSRTPMRAELCNGLDDDCDGIADDGFLCVFGTARAGMGTFGACTTAGSVSGTYVCGPTCTSETFSPSLPTETCNGADDDCDGILDDGYACVRSSTGNACVTACGTPGTYACTAACGVPSSSTTCAAAVETCNGCDDDRDGSLDEGFDADGMDPCFQGQTRSCTTPSGVAGATQVCRGDCRGWDTCRTADEGPANPPTCNAADDDGDGLVDEGFACAQNSITACSLTATAPVVSNTYPIVCGTVTNGRRRCDTNCAYLDSSCWTASEVCNYCEDDGDPVTTTDASIATAIVSDSFACNELTVSGGPVSGGPVSGGPTCGNFGTPVSDIGVRLVSAGTTVAPLFSRSGALWTRSATLTQSRPYVGWGPLTFLVQAQVARGTTTYPADGWSVVLARTGTGDRDTGYTGSVGTPRSRPNSLSVEWRFFTDALATEADQVSVVVTDASGARTTLGTVVPPTAVHLNSTTSGSINQTLIITYTPDDPRTLFRDDRFELRFNTTDPSPVVAYEMPTSLGGATTSTRCVGTCATPAAFGRHLEPGYPFELGVTAATGGSNASVSVTTALGTSAISGVIPLRVDRENVCF